MKFLFVLIALIVSLSACGTNMSKYESPEFDLQKKEGNFEIRSYKPGLMAVSSCGDRNTCFRKIFDFISGANADEQEIAMTIPVRMDKDTNENESMAFFMPKKFDRANLPEPLSDDVEIKEFPGGLYAANRFKGGADEEDVQQELVKLKDWLDQLGMPYGEEWYFDRFDGPFTLPFLRTNEVVIRLLEP